jgi:hypothetical protein
MSQKKPPLQDVIVRTTPRRERSPAVTAPREDSAAASQSAPMSTPAPEDAFRVVREDPRRMSAATAAATAPGHESDYVDTEHGTTSRIGGHGDYAHTHTRAHGGGGGIVASPWARAALGIAVVAVIASFAFSIVFAGATVTVHPRQETAVVNTTLLAQKDGAEESVPFVMYEVRATAQQVVAASEAQDVEERASGTITIYNEFSESPQRLIKNTRFENADGRIYRIRQSVEVPGMQGSEAGTVEAMVFAEEPGEAYNTEPGRFTIPGFVGMPQEGKMYAQSAAPMAGGFVGEKRIVQESDRVAAVADLEETLRTDLLAQLAQDSRVPEGGMYFDGGMFYEFNPLPDEDRTGEEIVLSLSGTLHVAVFDATELAAALARDAVSGYDGTPIMLHDTSALTLELQPAVTSDDEVGDAAAATTEPAWAYSAYMVRVQGKAPFVWLFDTEQLQRDIAGKDKRSLLATGTNNVLSAHPGIDRIEVDVRPFWKGTLPSNIEDITVETKLDV